MDAKTQRSGDPELAERLFAAAPTPFLVLAPDPPRFTIVAVNDAYLAATMTTREGIIQRGLFEVFPDNPDDANATGVGNLRASLERALKSKRADAMPRQKYDISNPNGSFVERWWDPINTPVLDEEGNVAALIHHVTDATDTERIEKRLRDREAWLEAQKEAFQAALNGANLATALDVLARTAITQTYGKVRYGFYMANADGTELYHITGMPEAYRECVDGFKIGPKSLACGLAVYTGHPVITPDVTKEPLWKSWLSLAQQFQYRACWSFPIRTSERKVVGTFAMYHEKPRRATPRDHELAATITYAAAIIISRHEEMTKRALVEEGRKVLINELNHRVKNTLATVQAVASQSLRGSTIERGVGAAFQGRLHALAIGHDILTRGNWEGGDLRQIIVFTLEPFCDDDDRLRVEGPLLHVKPKGTLALTMALHELATNATKYGALSNETGRIEVVWTIDSSADRIRLLWVESGGPPVTPPRRKGFGSRLIQSILAADFGVEPRIEYASGGVVCEIDAPLHVFQGD